MTPRINFTLDREGTVAEIMEKLQFDQETAERFYDAAIAAARTLKRDNEAIQ
jgi:hypothetical protein